MKTVTEVVCVCVYCHKTMNSVFPGILSTILIKEGEGDKGGRKLKQSKDVLNSHKVSYCCLPKISTIHIRKHILYTHIMQM